MPKPTIPKGWYRLRKGTVIKKGDKFWSGDSHWSHSSGPRNGKVGKTISCDIDALIYIRRKSKALK